MPSKTNSLSPIFLAALLAAACSDSPQLGAGRLLSWQPAVYTFGETVVGSSRDHTFVLKNVGAAAIRIDQILFAGGSDSAYSILSGGLGAAVELQPRAERAVVVRYSPTTTGESSAVLRAQTAAGSVDAVLSNRPPAPKIELDPPAIDFGVVLQGQTRERELKIRNTGTAPLNVTGIALSTTSSSEFTLDLNGNSLPFALDLLQNRVIKVRFTPSGTGTPTGAIEVSSNDTRQPVAIAQLSSGTSTPRISIDPTELAFGAVEQGQTKVLTVRVTNAGTATLTVNPSTTGSSDFRFSPATLSLAPNGNQNIEVTYAPSDAGSDEANLILSHNDPGQSALTVRLRGGAEPHIRPSPLGVQFSNVTQGTSVTQEVLLTNVGFGELVLGTIAFGSGAGQSHPDYALESVPTAGTRLTRGQSASFTIRYSKSGPSNPTAQVLIASNDPDSSSNPFPLFVAALDGIADLPPSASFTCSNCNGTTLQSSLPATVMLDGSGSSDPEGQALLHFWALAGIPAGSQAVIESPNAQQTSFAADVAGTYRVVLQVRDASGQMSLPVSTDIQVLQ